MLRPERNGRVHHRAGDLVTRRNSHEPMTVESVSQTPFGLSYSCCWFDGDDGLHFAEYPANQLEFLTASTNTPNIRVTTEPRLRSGGPVMTVLDIRKTPQTDFALCEWTGLNDRYRQRLFPVRGLVLSMFDDLSLFELAISGIDPTRRRR